MKCAVNNCNNENNSKACKISFFNFPLHPDLLKQWTLFCDRKGKFNVKTSHVCMDHFKADDFENNLQYEMGFTKRRLLKNGAVPTIRNLPFNNEELNEERATQKRENKKIVEMLLKEQDAEPVFKDTFNMNLNCDTFIKQEIPYTDEKLIDSLPSTEFNIPIKNEPISDECFPDATIKTETFSDTTFTEEQLTIKTEDQTQNQHTAPQRGDSFVIYELETQPSFHILPTLPQQNEKHVFNAITTLTAEEQDSNITQTKQLLGVNKNPSAVTNLQQNLVTRKVANHASPSIVVNSPPVLLNSQFRKRHKVILPANPLDKRTRYNIEGSKSNTSVLNHKADSSKTCRLLNAGSKKIINHLIKKKLNQRKQEESPISSKIGSIPLQNSKEEHFTSISNKTNLHHNSSAIEETTANTQIQKNVIDTSISPSSLTQSLSNSPKESLDPPAISELRVKCLCSLTDDTTTGNSDLKAFFKEMFEETRRLSKTQQRKVKMSLLQAVSEAEELMEQGKCCGF